MNAFDPLDSFTNFVFSIYGLLTLGIMLALFAVLWSDQLKRRWYDRAERKKWLHWNGPKRAADSRASREKPTTKA
jgi:hypothetical protein